MQHPQTSASTEPRAEGPLSLPDYGAGSGGFSVDSTVAGPYLTGIVTSGSYTAPLPSAIAVATAGSATQAPQASLEPQVSAAANAPVAGAGVSQPKSSVVAPSAASGQGAAAPAASPAMTRPHLPAVSRPDHLRRGNDRCVLLLPPQRKPDPALLASLERRNVETLICFDPHDVVARLCLMAREVQTAERKGLLPLPGGIALIVCEPAKVPQLASVVHTVRRYAARCVCWQFAPASAGASASLRPLSDDEILRAGGATAESATLPTPRPGLSLAGQAGGAGSSRAESPGLRLANWAISQADNPTGDQSDTLKDTFPHKKPPLTSPELAMLLAEIPEIPSAAATSQRAKDVGTAGPDHAKHRNGETPQ